MTKVEMTVSSAASSTAKRRTILNFQAVNTSQEYKDRALSSLRDSIRAVLSGSRPPYSFPMLTKIAENLCLLGQWEKLYGELKDLLEAHLAVVSEKFKVDTIDRLQYMQLMNTCWSNHCNHMRELKNIFIYMDRKYILKTPSVLSISELGVDLYRRSILSHSLVRTRTVDGVLMLINQEQNGDVVDRSLIKNIIKMLSDTDIYKDAFEKKFFSATEKLYSEEGKHLVEELDVPQYLNRVERRLKEESDRLVHYLDQSSKGQLIDIVEKHLIADHLNTILKKGLDELFEHERKKDLRLLYELVGRVKGGHHELKVRTCEYIKKQGGAIVLNLERDSTMVQALLDFKDKLDQIMSECFMSNEQFIIALKEAFEAFINQRQNKPAELIAKFVDSKLRAGNKEATEDEMEKMMDKIMVLFRFVHGKDVFEAFYKKDLAKRLLVGKSASVDSEKSMLSKLKAECGGGFTSKLEGMFKDMELSKDINVAFRSYVENLRGQQKMDMTVNVLSMAYWPSYPPMEVSMPMEMSSFQEIFKDFFVTKYSGRKLQWQANLGSCVLKAKFNTATKELRVSQIQAIVLLLFNSADELTYQDISSATKIQEGELRRTLQSLACGKARVLQKLPRGRDVEDKDRFFFNKDFTHALYMIKVNQVQMKETSEEQKATEERVYQDRQYLIDAAIVRIMKMRKTLSHTLLVTELYEQLKFPVNADDLKKRVDSLVERDYIAKDKENSSQYNYVA